MSYHIALRKLRHFIYGQVAEGKRVDEWASQAYWYALKDASGKIRDWIPACVGSEARRYFAAARGRHLLPGYRVERRGRTQHYKSKGHVILVCEPVVEIEE